MCVCVCVPLYVYWRLSIQTSFGIVSVLFMVSTRMLWVSSTPAELEASEEQEPQHPYSERLCLKIVLGQKWCVCDVHCTAVLFCGTHNQNERCTTLQPCGYYAVYSCRRIRFPIVNIVFLRFLLLMLSRDYSSTHSTYVPSSQITT